MDFRKWRRRLDDARCALAANFRRPRRPGLRLYRSRAAATAIISPLRRNGLPGDRRLNFNGRCEEALDFYRRALGAEVTTLMRFKDSPDPAVVTPGTEQKVMHSSMRIGDATILASDAQCQGQTEFKGISLTLTVPDAAEAERRFGALSDGGQVQMPLTQTL